MWHGMKSLQRRPWNVLARLVAAWRGRRAPTATELPAWAQVGKRRRAHIRRVAALVAHWADEMGASQRDRHRWLKAAWLHDALRDAHRTSGTTHGAAAADRTAKEGESDPGVLEDALPCRLSRART